MQFRRKATEGLKKVKAHGLGVHTAEEIEQFGKKDLQALSEMLGDKVTFIHIIVLDI